MSRSHSMPLAHLLVCILLAAAPVATIAQMMGPEAYGVPSRFGMGSPVSTRLLGMGGAMSCVDDVKFINPGFAALQQGFDAGLMMTTTSFDNGPRLTGIQAHYSQSLRPNQAGFQVSVLKLDSSSATMTLPVVGPVPVALSEDALVVDYGQRFGERLVGGLSVLGYQRSSFGIAPPAGPTLLHLPAKTDYGFRGGVAYEYNPGDWLGLTYCYAQNTVRADGVMLGVPRRTVFHSDYLSIGASRHLRPDTLVAVEFQRGKTSGELSRSSTDSWHLGAEHALAGQWALRAGLSDGSPTFGLGHATDRWRFDYAFVNNWNDDAARLLFGGSSTHSLHAIYSW